MNPEENLGNIVKQVAIAHSTSKKLTITEVFKKQFTEGLRFTASINLKYPVITQQLEIGKDWKDFLLKML